MAFEIVKIFNQPIVEVENGSMMNENLKLTVKIETTYPLKHPLVFAFTYTDGRYEELLKSVSLQAPEPKKQRFTTEIPSPNRQKAPLKGMLNGSAILVDVVYNAEILSRVPIHMIVEDVAGELKPPQIEEESFIPEEEDFGISLESIQDALQGKEGFDNDLVDKIRGIAQEKLEALKEEDKFHDTLPEFATEEQYARLKRDMIVLKNSVTDGQIKVQTATVDE